MSDENTVLREIDFCRARQTVFLGKKLRAKQEIVFCDFSISRLTCEIELLEDRLWWLRFIEYCNTPCWKWKE